jgi:hypothetical protein
VKDVRRVCPQTFIDTSTKVGFAKLYDRDTPNKAVHRAADWPTLSSREARQLIDR